MPRSYQLGSKIPHLPAVSKNKWCLICAYPHNASRHYSPLMEYYRTLSTDYIEVITTKHHSNTLSIYIVDTNQILRAALHDSPENPITESNIQSVMDSLRGVSSTKNCHACRPEIQGIENQPENPLCPNLDRIVGEYVLGDPKNVDPYLNDFLIYAFALIQEDGTLEPYSEIHLEQLANLRFANPELDVIMAIGGWANDGFSDAALTPKSRYDFAREVKKWVDRYSLDGVDIDWEYPGTTAGGITSRPEDRENFTLLLQALRDVLGPDAWISVAGIGENFYIDNVDIAAIAPIIDYFNVMAYDFTAGAPGNEGAGHHSNLYLSDMAYNNTSIDYYIQNLIDAGMPPEKILMGIGYYGRNGSTLTESFDQIRRTYLNKNGFRVKWDNEARAPYIVDPNGNFFLSYDNALSIYFKGQYVYENCLAGLFGWQATMDSANILINSMNQAMKDPKRLEDTLSKAYYG